MPSVYERDKVEEWRKKYALARGLPKSTSWRIIFAYDEEEWRKRKIRRYGLPDSATRSDIIDHEWELRQRAKEEQRRADARELGLRETASEKRITAARKALPVGSFDFDYPVDHSGKCFHYDDGLG